MTAIERLRRTGIRRLGSPKAGFRYRTPEGGPPPAAQVERVRRLVLPPAWTDVVVSSSPSSAIQAIGRDRAGRWPYVEKQLIRMLGNGSRARAAALAQAGRAAA